MAVTSADGRGPRPAQPMDPEELALLVDRDALITERESPPAIAGKSPGPAPTTPPSRTTSNDDGRVTREGARPSSFQGRS